MKTLFIVAKSHFPSKDASSIRYENFFYMFNELGFNNIVVFEHGNNTYLEPIQRKGYISICLRKKYNLPTFLSKVFNRFGLENRYIKEIKPRVGCGDLVFVSGNFSLRCIRKINSIAKAVNAKVILNVVEKYSKCNFPFNGFFSAEYRINENLYRHYKKTDPGVVCISTSIKNEFDKKNVPTVLIPFVFNKTYFDNREKMLNDKITFIYTGNPARKDWLSNMLIAFSKLDESIKSKILVRIIGVDKKWANKRLNKKTLLLIREFVVFEGKQTREYVIEAYSKSHYSILLRPFKKSYSKFGFPTKISESLFLKTPPVTNLTSDLKLYLVDGQNSIVVHGEDCQSFMKAIERAVMVVEKGLYPSLSLRAYETAINKLETKIYISELKKLL